MEKLKILLSGCSGRLGSAIVRQLSDRNDAEIICGVDKKESFNGFPVYKTFDGEECKTADVIIDCSHHSTTDALVGFAVENHLPLVICTTGHTVDEDETIHRASKIIPVFKSRNMSLGINLLIDLVRRCAAALGEDFDIEVVEAHHSKKLDAPSGTALMIADAAREMRKDTEYIYDRHSVRRERDKKEIGIHSVRGGTIVGEHSVIFAGNDEVITISHSAGSRDLFATGAIKAALFIINQKPGYFNMNDVIVGSI